MPAPAKSLKISIPLILIYFNYFPVVTVIILRRATIKAQDAHQLIRANIHAKFCDFNSNTEGAGRYTNFEMHTFYYFKDRNCSIMRWAENKTPESKDIIASIHGKFRYISQILWSYALYKPFGRNHACIYTRTSEKVSPPCWGTLKMKTIWWKFRHYPRSIQKRISWQKTSHSDNFHLFFTWMHTFHLHTAKLI